MYFEFLVILIHTSCFRPARRLHRRFMPVGRRIDFIKTMTNIQQEQRQCSARVSVHDANEHARIGVLSIVFGRAISAKLCALPEDNM